MLILVPILLSFFKLDMLSLCSSFDKSINRGPHGIRYWHWYHFSPKSRKLNKWFSELLTWLFTLDSYCGRYSSNVWKTVSASSRSFLSGEDVLLCLVITLLMCDKVCAWIHAHLIKIIFTLQYRARSQCANFSAISRF